LNRLILISFWVFNKKRYEPLKIHSIPFRSKDIIRDIKYSFGFSIAIALPFVLIIKENYRQHFHFYNHLNDYPLYWIPLSFLALVIGQDLYFYLSHRLMHHPILFKYIHSWHHQTTDPNPFSGLAMHPVEGLVLTAYNLTYAYFFPTYYWMYFIYQLLSTLFIVNGHLGVDALPKSWRTLPLLRSLNRATDHSAHHREFNVNFGLFFKFWDRIFGTHREDPIK
jgi:sterol desaturase/sphingolipid hydroxylase (fatty acid hydroxylase superfamily)